MRSFHILPLLSSIFLLSLSPSQALGPHIPEEPRARHRHVGKGHKRDANVAFTYFSDGLGACGGTNDPDDFIVALNSAEYDGGTRCGQTITITANGKTAQAKIADQCGGCAPGGLDLSSGLFKYFAPLSEGTFYGSWSYGDGDTTTSSSASPTTTMTTTTTTVMSLSSPQTLSTSAATSAVSTVDPSPTTTSTVPTSTPQDLQIIAQINLALLELSTVLRVLLST